MFLLSPQLKHKIKRSVRHVGLLGVINRIEYAYGNRCTPEALRLYQPFITPGSLCFDIGAHRGLKTKLFRQLGAKVVAVEPNEECVAAITALFGGDSCVIPIAAGCGAEEGEQTFFVCPLNPQNSTLSRSYAETSGYTGEFEMERTRRVAVVTLDGLIKRYGRPQFTKIDCEGYEAEILRGLSEPLRALSFEFRICDQDNLQSCMQSLTRLGFDEFNMVSGTGDALELDSWCRASQLLDLLERQPGDGCGDIFAVCSHLADTPANAC